ncbi:hypothetical protein [Trichothermofontia sp.]
MHGLKERYLVDEAGNRVAVVLDIQEYEQLLDALEELAAIQAYDAAKTAGDDVIPFEAAIAEIEQTKYNKYGLSDLNSTRCSERVIAIPNHL